MLSDSAEGPETVGNGEIPPQAGTTDATPTPPEPLPVAQPTNEELLRLMRLLLESFQGAPDIINPAHKGTAGLRKVALYLWHKLHEEQAAAIAQAHAAGRAAGEAYQRQVCALEFDLVLAATEMVAEGFHELPHKDGAFRAGWESCLEEVEHRRQTGDVSILATNGPRGDHATEGG